MTTITGMLSMLYYDAATGRYSYCNGGVNAPLAPLPGFNPGDLQGGRGVGVPSFWAAFEAARARHGPRPVAELMRPAIRYAREGFPIYPFLYAEMFAQYDTLGRTEAGRRIYMPECAILPPGAVLRQRELADTLERLQQEGHTDYISGCFCPVKSHCQNNRRQTKQIIPRPHKSPARAQRRRQKLKRPPEPFHIHNPEGSDKPVGTKGKKPHGATHDHKSPDLRPLQNVSKHTAVFPARQNTYQKPDPEPRPRVSLGKTGLMPERWNKRTGPVIIE
jgi:hypothetical protein